MRKLRRQINIKDRYAQLICDLASGYDGYSKAKDLKKLIDEMSWLASLLITCNDKEIMYIDSNNEKSYNILHEEIKGN